MNPIHTIFHTAKRMLPFDLNMGKKHMIVCMTAPIIRNHTAVMIFSKNDSRSNDGIKFEIALHPRAKYHTMRIISITSITHAKRPFCSAGLMVVAVSLLMYQ